MTRFIAVLAFLFCLIHSGSAHAQGPAGLWLTENGRSVISVAPCANDVATLCGGIHWIIEGGMQFDEKNPDAALRGQPLCGLKILGGFRQNDIANWVDGKIYKADEGDIYNASLQMLPNGKLLVRGYVGMPLFGKSQTWTRVSGDEYPKCRAPNT